MVAFLIDSDGQRIVWWRFCKPIWTQFWYARDCTGFHLIIPPPPPAEQNPTAGHGINGVL